MCVIIYKPAKIALPDYEILKNCWDNNHGGAGYSYLDKTDNKVHFEKGIMTLNELITKLNVINPNYEIIIHFRIPTQAKQKEMTHPFLYTTEIEKTKILKATTNSCIFHNGVIPMTSNGDQNYSDTALFITQYMHKIIRNQNDLEDPCCHKLIKEITRSKWAFMTRKGVTLIGDYIYDKKTKCYYSNHSFDDEYFRNKFLSSLF